MMDLIKQSSGDETWDDGESIHYVIGMKKAEDVREELKEV